MPRELEVLQQGGRLVLRLRVSPGARQARVLGVHGGALKLAVAEPPERGKANAGVIALLATALGLASRNVEILSGGASQDKRVAISGFRGDAQELKRLLL